MEPRTENVKRSLRSKSKPNYTTRRSLLILFVLLALAVLLTVQGWSSPAARADGAGISSPSSASASVPPTTQVPRGASTGVYLGCQELVPSAELPESSR